MSDEPELGPDPNNVRRHAKKIFTEAEYRRKYCRLDFYKPNRAQLRFHALTNPEKALFAGNQQGKTHAAGFEFASHATAIYPMWWTGRRFDKPLNIERPIEWLGWASCTTTSMVRDGAQLKLLGPIREEGGLGSGLIPLDNIIGRPLLARGIHDIVDIVSIQRETGGKGRIQFKSYDSKREAYQGSAVDVNWLDEDVSRTDDSIYGECLARTTMTRGIIMCSLSLMLGPSPLYKRFMERDGKECAQVTMNVDDTLISNGGHFPDEDLPALLEKYPEHQRKARLYGLPMQGEGAVFDTPEDRIKFTQDPAEFPSGWWWMWALDFRHSGSETTGHPFAAVLVAYDPDRDAIYVVEAIRMLGLAPMHVAAMREHPFFEAPVAWPHDGGKGASLVSGETIVQVYKKLGLNTRPTHATFREGGYNFESGIDEMARRFATEKLKIRSNLNSVFEEYRGYHRIDNAVNKVNDDLLSAIRIACMDIRFAEPVWKFRARAARRKSAEPAGLATGLDFDLFTGA